MGHNRILIGATLIGTTCALAILFWRWLSADLDIDFEGLRFDSEPGFA